MWGQEEFLGADGIGALDFAGGDVVHISSGVSVLVLVTYLGKRHDYEHSIYRIHNIPGQLQLVRRSVVQGCLALCGSALPIDGLRLSIC